jgi:hypothetical protein
LEVIMVKFSLLGAAAIAFCSVTLQPSVACFSSVEANDEVALQMADDEELDSFSMAEDGDAVALKMADDDDVVAIKIAEVPPAGGYLV